MLENLDASEHRLFCERRLCNRWTLVHVTRCNAACSTPPEEHGDTVGFRHVHYTHTHLRMNTLSWATHFNALFADMRVFNTAMQWWCYSYGNSIAIRRETVYTRLNKLTENHNLKSWNIWLIMNIMFSNRNSNNCTTTHIRLTITWLCQIPFYVDILIIYPTSAYCR